jgi:hypothetical protein
MKHDKQFCALWLPSWYCLDQPISVEQESEFTFATEIPLEYSTHYRSMFYNDMPSTGASYGRRCKITSIYNNYFGQIESISLGLDYTLTTLNRSTYRINAEEEPGSVYSETNGVWSKNSTPITNWVVEVSLIEVA